MSSIDILSISCVIALRWVRHQAITSEPMLNQPYGAMAWMGWCSLFVCSTMHMSDERLPRGASYPRRSIHYIITLHHYLLSQTSIRGMEVCAYYIHSHCAKRNFCSCFQTDLTKWPSIYLFILHYLVDVFISNVSTGCWTVPVWRTFATGAFIPWREQTLYYYSVVFLSIAAHAKKPFSASLNNFE